MLLNKQDLPFEEFKKQLIEKADFMSTSRPTAVNLMWACKQLKDIIENSTDNAEILIEKLTKKSIEIEKDDLQRCQNIGDNGAAIVPKGGTILTHCNAGALATGGYGTALGVVRSAFGNDNTDPTIIIFRFPNSFNLIFTHPLP